MVEKRKTYTTEFKREAVRLVTEHHYGVAEAARNLGINTNRLRRWKREFAANENGAFPALPTSRITVCLYGRATTAVAYVGAM